MLTSKEEVNKIFNEWNSNVVPLKFSIDEKDERFKNVDVSVELVNITRNGIYFKIYTLE